MNVWASGASGLHLFNNFSPRSPIWEEIGDPTLLATKTKLYFATVRDGDPRSYLKTGRSYRTTPVLTPAHPVLFTGDRRVAVPVHVGRVPAADADASITCHVRIPSRLKPEQVSVSLNDTVLQNGQLKEEWLDYAVPAGALKPGDNLVSIGVVPRDPGAEATWSISTALMDLPGAPWERDPGSSATTVERVESEGVRIADRGTNSGDYCYFRNAWGASFEAGAVAEVEAKVVSGESCLIISDSQSGERLVLAPGHITLWHNRSRKHDMDTTSDFHRYRLEAEGTHLRVLVDGDVVLDLPDGLPSRPYYRQNQLKFGATNSPGEGEAIWRAVRARTTGIASKDIVIKVAHAE